MKKGLMPTLLLATILALVLVSPLSEALIARPTSTGNYDRTFTFDVQNGLFRSTHTLDISIPTSLYDYYESRSHTISTDTDYAKFITPTVFSSIAENIQTITNNAPYSDEQFANAVLTLVRQITYNKSNAKYPVEAIAKNSGDCDVLSLVAASIMKAGGLDIILFHYKGLNPSHMNIGVYLPHTPIYRSWWIPPTGFEYNNKTYWIAESTSLGNWKVGEKPDLLTNQLPYIIPLENSGKKSPGQIASSLDTPLLPSNISITLSSVNSSLYENQRPLTVRGIITPALPDKKVVMYVDQGGHLETFKTTTDDQGTYSFAWNLTGTGTYDIQTSCTDIANYSGADSEKLTVFGSNPPITDESATGAEGTIARANFAGFGNLINQEGKEFLTSNVSGTGALLSGEFIILNNNLTATPNVTVVAPRIERAINFPRGRQPITIIWEETVRAPEVPPNGQFGFILQQSGQNNYSASVRILKDQDISQIATQLSEKDSTFLNASEITQENIWYKIVATISQANTNVTLYEENGTPLNNLTPRDLTISTSEVGILMQYNPGAIIAFRNLKVQSLPQTVPALPSVSATQIPRNLDSPYLYIGLFAILAVVATAIMYLRRRKSD